jgi:hypothetical protein
MTFVKDRPKKPTSSVTMGLRASTYEKNKKPELWELITAWTGPTTPAYPGTPYETAYSADFWSTHGLTTGINGRQPFIEETKTTVRPF